MMDGSSSLSEVVMVDLDNIDCTDITMDSIDIDMKQHSPQPLRRLFGSQCLLSHSPSTCSLPLPVSGSSSPSSSNFGGDTDRMCKRKSSTNTAPDSKRPARTNTHDVDKLSLEDVVDCDGETCPVKWVNVFTKMSSDEQELALCHLVERCSLPQVRLLQHRITPFFQKDFLSCLPVEIALFIVSLLGPRDMAMAARTCQHWRTLCENLTLWKEACEELGISGEDVPSLRIEGEWRNPANGQGITIYDHMSSDEAFVARREKERLYGTCFKRCEWKARYLRHFRIVANWKSRPIAASCILRGHEDHVITCLQIRGDVLVTGSDDNTLKVWSISTASLRFTLTGHIGGVWSSQLSEDGKYIVSGSTDRTVRVWSAEDGQQLHVLQGHTSTVSLNDGYSLVSGSRDMTLRVWDIETGECLRILIGHVAAVRCVQFDGRRVVSGAYDFAVKVWLVETGECIHSLTGHSNRVYSLLLDSERSLVVSGSLDTTIKVWDIERGVCTATLVGHQSLTSGMQLRGNILVSGNADSTVRIWDISDGGQCLHQLTGPQGHRSAVTSLQFLSSNLVATSSDDGCVKLWDVTTGNFVRDLIRLQSGGSGGCIWRLKATDTLLACAVGSRNGTEDTKLILIDFDAAFP